MKSFDNFGVNSAIVLLILGVLSMYVVLQIYDFPSSRVLSYIFATAPIWLPIASFIIFFESWLFYVQKKFDLEQGRVTLEIKLPNEIKKSPEAMELIFNQLHQTASPDNHVQTYVDGKHPPTYGLEIVSRGGDVRFYMSVPRKKFKNMAETQLYAQYPGIEIHELDIDYTAEIPWDPKRFFYFTLHFNLKKADALPIKTYVDYGLTQMPKEEEKNDPITTMIEALGSIGPGEHIWIQYLITANREVNFKTGSLTTQPDWKDDARKHIKGIIDKAKERADGEVGGNVLQLLTDTERETIKAVERSIGKNAFDTAIRTMYIAPADKPQPGERIPAIISSFRAYDDLNKNAIGPRWRTDFDWNWWQDPKDRRKTILKKQELDEYKRRTYTKRSSIDGTKVFTVEELATIFHLPGQVALTPTLSRIPSARSEAPANLPTAPRL